MRVWHGGVALPQLGGPAGALVRGGAGAPDVHPECTSCQLRDECGVGPGSLMHAEGAAGSDGGGRVAHGGAAAGGGQGGAGAGEQAPTVGEAGPS